MNIKVSENDPRVVEAILRKDFYAFIQAVFPLVSPNRPMMRNWHLEAMAYHRLRVLNGEIRRLIITVPPRSLKSICASVAFPAFALGHRPELRFICASYAENLAKVSQEILATSFVRGFITNCFRTPKSSRAKTTRWNLQPHAEVTG